ncbi:MAG: glutamine synthetase type III, partial [Clostridia bacterium]|nr:glutamine synthetase type III [Clostridia bacterium]
MPHILDEKNVKMLTAHKVFTVEELKSRCDIMLENYCKSVTIEANTMADMAKTLIAPAVERFAADLAKNAAAKKTLNADIACGYETWLVKKLSDLTDTIAVKVDELQSAGILLRDAEDVIAESVMIRDKVLPKMCELRLACDEAETVTARSYWPFPTYADILFSVR